ISAHMEGTVMRVRPKLMTVATMLVGLIPLLWATGSGADVMKRIAAPMVGGLVTSAFLTLEIIPVISTYWRREELLWDRLGEMDAPRLQRLRAPLWVLAAGWFVLLGLGVTRIYVAVPTAVAWAAMVPAELAIVVGTIKYLVERRPAQRIVWPTSLSPVG